MAVINIIGNGFDRSHGLATSYGEFIKYLVEESINYNEDIRQNLIDVGKIFKDEQSYDSIRKNFENLIRNKQIEFKNSFLRVLMDKYFEADWIDIESFYFYCLIKIRQNEIQRVKNLHKEFAEIKFYLQKYLNSLTSNKDTFIENYIKLFTNKKHKNNIFLNFNYTNTLNKYLVKLESITPAFNFQNIQIHGRIFDESNPIVFGYGDENEDYFRIREYDNAFTQFHKTHIYPLNSHKTELLNYLNNETNILVNIFGHSCGISDRILLRTIFEHKNVKKIKVNYYQSGNSNNFQDLTSNITKTVSSNAILDEKLISMPYSSSMPQIDKS